MELPERVRASLRHRYRLLQACNVGLGGFRGGSPLLDQLLRAVNPRQLLRRLIAEHSSLECDQLWIGALWRGGNGPPCKHRPEAGRPHPGPPQLVRAAPPPPPPARRTPPPHGFFPPFPPARSDSDIP